MVLFTPSRRNTFVGGRCALPSALLVWFLNCRRCSFARDLLPSIQWLICKYKKCGNATSIPPGIAFQSPPPSFPSLSSHFPLVPFPFPLNYLKLKNIITLKSTSSPVHTGDKVDRISNKVDRDKLSNSSCCRFVAGFGNSRQCRQCVPGLRDH